VKIRKARVGRNPNAPETDVHIPQRAVVKFKPGKEMREEVLKITPETLAAAEAAASLRPPEPENGDDSMGSIPGASAPGS
jgi:DNA-binding protein HU-beta/integration host factor subunit alpha